MACGGWNLYQKMDLWICDVDMRTCGHESRIRPSMPLVEPRVDHLETPFSLSLKRGVGQCVHGS